MAPVRASEDLTKVIKIVSRLALTAFPLLHGTTKKETGTEKKMYLQ